MPRWLIVTLFGALLTGAGTGVATIAGVVIQSERAQVREELLEKQRAEDKRQTEAWQREITAQLVAFRAELADAGKDRWTASQDLAQDARLESRLVRRLDKADLQAEATAAALAKALAELAETVRRVDRFSDSRKK